MTQIANARIAGVTFLLYISFGVASMVFLGTSSRAEGVESKLASIAEHVSTVRLELLVSVLICFTAISLAVSLFGLTRDVDIDLAVMVLVCRGIEAALGVVSIFATTGTLWLATATGPNVPESTSGQAIAVFLFKVQEWNFSLAAIFFAVGSTVFSFLLVRGRLVPTQLAWLGIIASVLLVLIMPLQLTDIVSGTRTFLVWLPMLVFELTIAYWFIFRGIRVEAKELWDDGAIGGRDVGVGSKGI